MRVLYKAQKFYGLILKEKSVEKYLEKLKRSVLITNDAELF